MEATRAKGVLVISRGGICERTVATAQAACSGNSQQIGTSYPDTPPSPDTRWLADCDTSPEAMKDELNQQGFKARAAGPGQPMRLGTLVRWDARSDDGRLGNGGLVLNGQKRVMRKAISE